MEHIARVKRKTAGRDTPAAEIEYGINRDYISPSGGALNTRWVTAKMDFIFSCLLSSKNLITGVYHPNLGVSRTI
jgi:hypothetical protein